MKSPYVCKPNLFKPCHLVPEVRGTSFNIPATHEAQEFAVADSNATQPEQDTCELIRFFSTTSSRDQAGFAAHGRSIVLRECPIFFVVCVSEVTSH
jgi:hypothetical protein